MKKSEATRQDILAKAFGLVYRNGFGNTSLDDILSHTGVTKGAFYYHFRNKEDMAVAMIEELLKPVMRSTLIAPLSGAADPLRTIYGIIEELLLRNPALDPAFGCPAANLSSELSGSGALLREALEGISEDWAKHLESLIGKGKRAGLILRDADPKSIAVMVISGYWGVRTLGKVRPAHKVYKQYLSGLRGYLEGFRVSDSGD